MDLAEKKATIRLANAWETCYAMSLQKATLLGIAEEGLKLLVTEGFLQEIISNYEKKRFAGEYALDCYFSIPNDNEMLEEKGVVSFTQKVRIMWSGGQVDNFTTVHRYRFSGVRISQETGKVPLRRQYREP